MLHKVLIYIYKEAKTREHSFSNVFSHPTLSYVDPTLNLTMSIVEEDRIENSRHSDDSFVFTITTDVEDSMPLHTTLGCEQLDDNNSSVLMLGLADDNNSIVKLLCCYNPVLTSVEESSVNSGEDMVYKFTVTSKVIPISCDQEVFDLAQTLIRYNPNVNSRLDSEKKVNTFIYTYDAISFDHRKEDKEMDAQDVKQERGQTSSVQYLD